VTEAVAWAASNGDRSENADYQYGKRRLRQIDGRIRFLTKRIEAAEVEKSRLFGPPQTLAETLLKRVKAIEISTRVAVSSNLHAAVCMVRGMSPKDQIIVIPPGQEAKALASLPLTVLDLSEEQAKTFSLWGIHTLCMVAALPEKSLIARMGQEGQRFSRLAKGIGRISSYPWNRPSNLKNTWNLMFPWNCLLPCFSSSA
jgi:hypothetical protein